MTQLQGLLEAEQWVAVDVPAGFQVLGVCVWGGGSELFRVRVLVQTEVARSMGT